MDRKNHFEIDYCVVKGGSSIIYQNGQQAVKKSAENAKKMNRFDSSEGKCK